MKSILSEGEVLVRIEVASGNISDSSSFYSLNIVLIENFKKVLLGQ